MEGCAGTLNPIIGTAEREWRLQAGAEGLCFVKFWFGLLRNSPRPTIGWRTFSGLYRIVTKSVHEAENAGFLVGASSWWFSQMFPP